MVELRKVLFVSGTETPGSWCRGEVQDRYYGPGGKPRPPSRGNALSIFVDTSAILALLNADETRHNQVAEAWVQLLNTEVQLVLTDYIIVETVALLQSRIGMEAVRCFIEDMRPLFEVLWIDRELHERAVSALLVANRRRLSLVDCSSFESMRSHGIDEALTLDPHFQEQGFRCFPV